MFLNIGSDFLVNLKDVIGIFDLDITTVSTKTKGFLKESEKNGVVISIDSDLPKTYIIATMYNETRIYLTSLSCSTLRKRIDNTYSI